MGQRHQVYLRLPDKKYPPLPNGKSNPNSRPEVTIGLHNQWLYGVDALGLLRQALRFASYAAQDEYHVFWESDIRPALDALAAIYSVDVDTGFYHRVHRLPLPTEKGYKAKNDPCIDPRLEDNNNGITVIDVASGNPSYCFLSIEERGMECLHEEVEEAEKAGTPLYRPFVPIDAERWVQLYYGRDWRTNAQTPKVAPGGISTEEAVRDVMRFPLITPRRLAEIFPGIAEEIRTANAPAKGHKTVLLPSIGR